MDDYISKPIRIQEVQSALERWGGIKVNQQISQRTDSLIDNGIIEQLIAMEEVDPGFFGELIDMYVEDSEKLISDIDIAIKEKDSQRLGKESHGLKGISANIGAMVVSDLALELENKGKNGDLSDIEALFTELKNLNEQTIIQLKKYKESTIKN